MMQRKICVAIGLVIFVFQISSDIRAAAESGNQFIYLPIISRAPTGKEVCAEEEICTWQEIGAGSATGGGISNTEGYSAYPSIGVAPNGTPYVAWEDIFGINSEIYVKKWNGSSWKEVGVGSASGGGISNNSGDSRTPSLAIAPNGTLYIAWENEISGIDSEIYVKTWNGSSWVEVGAGSASGGGISNTFYNSDEPSIAIAPDGTPYVAWTEHDGPPNIYVRTWNGSSWVEVGAGSASGGGISNANTWAFAPSIAISPDGMPLVAWADAINFINEIYLRSWNGSSWVEVGAGSASGGGISNNSGYSNGPSLAVAPDGKRYVAWWDNTSGNWEIFVRTWNGSSWAEVGTGSATGGGISNNSGDSWKPSLVVAPLGTPYVAWMDTTTGPSGNWEIFVRTWNGSNWTEAGIGSASGGGISKNDEASEEPSLAVDENGFLYAAWGNNQINNNFEIHVKRFIE